MQHFSTNTPCISIDISNAGNGRPELTNRMLAALLQMVMSIYHQTIPLSTFVVSCLDSPDPSLWTTFMDVPKVTLKQSQSKWQYHCNYWPHRIACSCGLLLPTEKHGLSVCLSH